MCAHEALDAKESTAYGVARFWKGTRCGSNGNSMRLDPRVIRSLGKLLLAQLSWLLQVATIATVADYGCYNCFCYYSCRHTF